MALHEYLGATSLADVLTKLKTWIQGEVPKAIPAGGTTGQVLKKASNTDRDVTWGNASSGGGHTIVDGTGTSMADESNLQFVGLSVTDDSTNGRTVVDASGKMNTDGSNAANHVTFGGAFTVGGRKSGTVGTSSVAEGSRCSASGNYSHAEGEDCDAYGMRSHAEGYSCMAFANNSHAEGYNCIADNDASASHSEGYQTRAMYEASHSEGYWTFAYGGWSHCEGGFDNDGISTVTSNIYLYSNITSSSTAIAVYSLISDTLADYYHMCLNIKIGNRYAEGFLATKTKTGTTSTNTKYIYTIRLFGQWGGSSYSSGTSVSEIYPAYSNTSYGLASHAEGGCNIAGGEYSHAEGLRNYAGGDYSHAEGALTSASGDYSHAEGSETVASGMNSHAEGDATKATHSYSHAEGQGTKTGKSHQHVQGKYNVGSAGNIFEIGDGTSDGYRHNAFAISDDGRVGISGVMSQYYTFHIASTAAATAVAWCNKVAMFSAPSRAVSGSAFTFSVTVKVGDTLTALAFDNATTITSISLYDAATAKVNALAAANYTYTESINSNKNIVFTFTIAASAVTAAIATGLNAVIDSKSPGFSCVYAANTLNLTGTIKGKGIVEQIPGFASTFNTLPTTHMTQHIGDFYIPTGGARWSIDVEVDPGTAYMAVCYLENTTTGAYFNHSICYTGVPVPTIAAPTVAPAPVAGKVIAFVGTTWTPFVTGVAGVVTDGVVTTKPRMRITGYNSSNTPTAGNGMHMRLYRVY